MNTEGILLLNATYEPLMVIGWEKAIAMLWLDKAEALVHYDREIRGVSRSIKMPAVMRLRRRVRYRKPAVRFNRTNVYTRDNFRCQYCGKAEARDKLTYDHVIPKSQGGKTTWSNIVTCCESCNRKKGCKTPEQARMNVIKTPKKPDWLPMVGRTILPKNPPQAWKPFLWNT